MDPIQTRPGNTHCGTLCIVLSTKYLHIKSNTVYVPSSELGLSQPLSLKRLCPLLNQRVGGTHSPADWGSPNSNDRKKMLSTLPTVWYNPSTDMSQTLPWWLVGEGLKTTEIKTHWPRCLLFTEPLALFYYRKTYALVSNQVCKPGFCIRRRSGTHVIPTLARSE